jgi:thiol-disulfide isomerase/thioredoxin
MNRRRFFALATASAAIFDNPAFAAPQGLVMNDAPKPMPELQFTDHDGKLLSLADFKGKVVLLNIWATWCGPCRKEMPALDRLQVQLGGPDFMVLPVSIDRKGFNVVDVFYVEIGIQHLAAYVAPAANHTLDTLGVWGLPASLLLDTQGRELGRLEGPAEWDAPDMISFLKTIIAKQKEATP